jgi:4'-phosphopantetheinyl transferase
MRSALRRLLGNYLEFTSQDLEIAYSHYGKPCLVNLDIHKKINFNISHADKLGLIAIAMDRQVGVDLELVRQEDSIEAISQRFFTPEESKQIMSLPASLQPEAFFTCWTRKEAFIKARGEGLSIPLDQFEVSIYPKDDPKLLIIKNNPVELGMWTMFHLEPGDHYVGALVVDGKKPDVIGWEMPITSNPRD